MKKGNIKGDLLFRKAFIPWYDNRTAMVVTLCFTVAAFLFSLVGVAAALDRPEYRPHLWVPGLLGLISLAATLSLLIRLIRRS